MALLQATWKANNIDSFLNDDQRNWPHPLVLRYDKQLYLMRYIRNQISPATGATTEEEAAVTADLLRVELGIKTVNKFLKHLKQNDHGVINRTFRGRYRPAMVARHPPQEQNEAVGVAVGVHPPPPPPPQLAPQFARRRQPPIRQPTADAFALAFGVVLPPPPPPPPPGQPPVVNRFIIRGDADPPPWERHNNEYGHQWRRNVAQAGFVADTPTTSGRRFRDVDDSP